MKYLVKKGYLLFFNAVFSFCLVAQPDQKSQEAYQLTLRKTSERIVVDGELNEAVWSSTDSASNFWMNYPVDGLRVGDELKTIVRVTYDDTYLYIAAICMGAPPFVVQSLKRDNPLFWTGDAFAVVIDPVNEKTNGFIFGINPEGVQTEALITGEPARRGAELSGYNDAWDNKWYAQSKIQEDRWTTEMAIPFKTLRFGEKEHWGINFNRLDAKSNSHSSWTPVPRQFYGVDLGYTGTIVWDRAPKKIKNNISIIPYMLSGGYEDFEANTDAAFNARVGLDAKVAVTSSLNLDLTVNPDFSQVDVDEQQTNLTTVDLNYPEKRLLFLENSDIFGDFGTPPLRPFFSRKIGLDGDGNTIPVLYGARLSGNLNKNLRMGLMNTQTREEELPGNNYTSLAMHQRILKRSTLRGYLHNRQGYFGGSSLKEDYNRVGGLEFSYRSQDSQWQAVGGYGLSIAAAAGQDNYFYNLSGGYNGKSLSMAYNLTGMGDNYINDFGFMPRQYHYDAIDDTVYVLGFDHWYGSVGYIFYPQNSRLNQHGVNVMYNGDRTATSLELIQDKVLVNYNFTFKNTSKIDIKYTHEDINLLFPFGFTEGYDPLPVGLYQFDYGELQYQGDGRRLLQLQTGFSFGQFYNGYRTGISVSAKYRVQPWGNFSLNFIENNLVFPKNYGKGRLFLISPKAEINFSKNLFWTTFMQYNTQRDNFNINSRLQWRYLPMSDLFLVYSDNYLVDNFGPRNRAFVIKLNYWLNL
jgi:hypothetical protein